MPNHPTNRWQPFKETTCYHSKLSLPSWLWINVLSCFSPAPHTHTMQTPRFQLHWKLLKIGGPSRAQYDAVQGDSEKWDITKLGSPRCTFAQGFVRIRDATHHSTVQAWKSNVGSSTTLGTLQSKPKVVHSCSIILHPHCFPSLYNLLMLLPLALPLPLRRVKGIWFMLIFIVLLVEIPVLWMG